MPLATTQTYKKPESVLIVVHDPDGRILLLRRVDIENFWQSVTGSLHWGERPQHAAVRELAEETGIRMVDKLVDWDRSVTFEILDTFKPRYPPHTHQNLEHMYSLQVQANHPVVLNPKEHRCYTWTGYTDAMDIVWSWSNRLAIQAVAERYWQPQGRADK